MDDIKAARKVIADLERELVECRSGQVASTYFTKFPPPSLAWRVGGADPTGTIYPDFLVSGLQVVHNILTLLSRQGLTQADVSKVLDFGCGCGRVTRFLAYEKFCAEIIGCDIDPEAIAWCRENIDIAEFLVSPYHPPLEFPDSHFDLVYSISIFTHLNEEEQFAWLQELRRVIRPGGIAILTTQGHNANYQRLPAEVKAQLEHDGIWYDVNNVYFEASKTYGFVFPESFKLTYHTHDYVRRNWSKYFQILEIADKAISYNQDAIVLRKME